MASRVAQERGKKLKKLVDFYEKNAVVWPVGLSKRGDKKNKDSLVFEGPKQQCVNF